jgi:hypothetical protein
VHDRRFATGQASADTRIEQSTLQNRVKAENIDIGKDSFPAADVITMGNVLHGYDEPLKQRLIQAETIAVIDQLLDSHPGKDIATLLNARGYASGTGQPFQRGIVKHLRHGR